ncbi:MAG: hypothetical protein ACR2RE_15975 [Geminicoccaceae bacterium]
MEPKNGKTDFKPWVAIGGVAAFVGITSMAHFSDGARHETQEQKTNRIRRIVGEEIDRLVPPPEVRAQLRRLQEEVEKLREKIK